MRNSPDLQRQYCKHLRSDLAIQKLHCGGLNVDFNHFILTVATTLRRKVFEH